MRPLTEAETHAVFSKLANYTGRSLRALVAPASTAERSGVDELIEASDPVDETAAAQSGSISPQKTEQGQAQTQKAKTKTRAQKKQARQAEADAHTQPRCVFRLHRSRVYYVPLPIANLAANVARSNLLSLGTCLGKFTKAGAFRLHITALDVLAPHARARVWVKSNGEMPFLYGGHVVRAHVGRWSDDAQQHEGVVVCNMSDVPLGFGVTARSTAEARKLDPTGVVTFRQADVGEYLRDEDTLFAST